MNKQLKGALLLGAALAGSAAPAYAAGLKPRTSRVSISSGGVQGNGDCYSPVLSANARYVAFASDATNLVVRDVNGVRDIFVRDRHAGTTERVSIDSFGVQGDKYSGSPGYGDGLALAMSKDGRFVAFTSLATNLVVNDTNGKIDIFVRDRQAGTTERVSVGQGGAQADDDSFDPAISDDGRYVAFSSRATNLVPGDTNGTDDVFVRDRQAGTTTRASVGAGGVQGNGQSFLPSLSGDGRYVAFETHATTIVRIVSRVPGVVEIVRDLQTQTFASVMPNVPGGWMGSDDRDILGGRFSADGTNVAFSSSFALVPSDTNGQIDVYVASRVFPGLVARVSIGNDGAQADEGAGFGNSRQAISADGRYVAFSSHATNLVVGDTNQQDDAFVRDRHRPPSTRRISISTSGAQVYSNTSTDVAISANGGYVAFASRAPGLVLGDTNGMVDIFVRPNF